ARHGGPARRPGTAARHGGPARRPGTAARHGGPARRPGLRLVPPRLRRLLAEAGPAGSWRTGKAM
ncbi:hypothetical protein AB0J38_11640, partial [Streptomyces sp. NPDC050095]